jgi:hypothetical protein
MGKVQFWPEYLLKFWIVISLIHVDALSETRSPCCEYTEPLLKSVGWTLYETIVSVFCGYLQKYYTHIYIENHSHRPDKIEW